MKKDFRTFKNFILLIASALSLVAVTFAWFSLSKNVGNFVIESNVSGSTIAVSYFESKDKGNNYTKLVSDLSMENMQEGEKAYYKMNVKTFSDKLIKIVMSFEGLSGNNTTAQHVYFDYKIVCDDTGSVVDEHTGLKMSDYASTNVFAADVSALQRAGHYNFTIYYDVYVHSDGAFTPSSDTVSLGEVKLTGQQVS